MSVDFQQGRRYRGAPLAASTCPAIRSRQIGRRCLQIIAATVCTFTLAPCHAQAPTVTAARPSFEVATVKPLDPADGPGPGAIDYSVTTAFSSTDPVWTGSLRHFIKVAYGLENFQLLDPANQLTSAFFVIHARTPAPSTVEQEKLMLQTLLADRFKLVAHTESKALPVYSLTIAKGGPSLKVASDSEKESGVSSSTGAINNLRGPMDTSTLAHELTELLGRTVLDNTGLKDVYKISLRWSSSDVNTSFADDSEPSISKAIQEQLGLRLESTKGPAHVLVIDHAEKPSPN